MPCGTDMAGLTDELWVLPSSQLFHRVFRCKNILSMSPFRPPDIFIGLAYMFRWNINSCEQHYIFVIAAPVNPTQTKGSIIRFVLCYPHHICKSHDVLEHNRAFCSGMVCKPDINISHRLTSTYLTGISTPSTTTPH